jgi:hypothetical protein
MVFVSQDEIQGITMTSKGGQGAVYPDNALESGFADGEPLITPEILRGRHLFGIPLVSALRDPVTHTVQRMEDPLIKDFIHRAVALAEAETGLDIFPRQYKERQPYDRPAQMSFGYMVLRHRPATSVQELAVVSSDGVNVWGVPLQWIDTGYLHQGQINLIPFAVGSTSGTAVTLATPSGAGLLPQFLNANWVPGFWNAKYTAGFPDGVIPIAVNELIGTVAAMEILSALATTYARVTSASLGIDGLSQSQSFPGAEIFLPRLQDLAQKRKWLVSKLKRIFGLGIVVDNV